jgi:hypothetical protein
MVEKLAMGTVRLVRREGPGLVRRLSSAALGRWVALGVVALVGGRALWVSATRPAHRHEIATAFGSAGILYGQPQADQMGEHITYVQQSDKGLAVFLCDTATGQAEVVHEEPEEGVDFGLRVWPWSPDTGGFIYSVKTNLVICQPGLRLSATEVPIPPGGIRALVWVDPETITYLGNKGDLQLLRSKFGVA